MPNNPGKFIARLFACLVLLGFSSAQAQTVLIHLKNGDLLRGLPVTTNASELILNSTSLGKIVIPLSQIEKTENLAAPLLPTPTTNAIPTNPPPVIVVKPKPVTPPKPKRWNSEFQFGVNLRYSTKDQEDFFTTAKISYALDHLRNTAEYNFAYGKTEGVLSANRMAGLIKTDYDLSKRFYVYNLMGAGYDQIRKIDLQYEVGPGFGMHVLTRTNFLWNSEIGVSYQEQFRSDSTDQRTYSVRLAEIVSWKISDKVVTDAKVEYFPNLERFENYRLRMEAILKYALLKNLSLNLNVIDLYDTLPAQGVEKNDLQIRSALGLRF